MFHRDIMVFSEGIQGLKEEAFRKTTHLAIGAHQDDIEIMAMSGILQCFNNPNDWFSGVTLSVGVGKNKKDIYQTLTDDQLKYIRLEEQKKAAIVGNYAASVSLKYQTQEIRKMDNNIVKDIKTIILMMKPRIIFIHNPFDNYNTHVASCLIVLKALQEIREEYTPEQLLGCEVWGSLDWLPAQYKIYLPIKERDNIMNACLGVYDTQIYDGKRYDLGVIGRLQSNAIFSLDPKYGYENKMGLAIDLKHLIWENMSSVFDFVNDVINSFKKNIILNLIMQ